ncbi:MAG TPA: hypothetical protein VGQ57_04935, partial [Polyangiaceae bacterium]|nr:hypothetical protein [Polyangiaceae bacterium]
MRTASRSRGRARRQAWASLALATLAAVGCGRSAVFYEDDSWGARAQAGTGATGGGAPIGGASSNGTGGTGGTGTKGGTGGSARGGSSTTTGGSSGISGSAGFAPVGPFACEAVAATCTSFTEFPNGQGVTWGSGAFAGGVTVTGSGLTRAEDSSALRVSGVVQDSDSGFELWFRGCADLSAFTGVEMTLSGHAGDRDSIIFQPLTSDDYFWEAHPEEARGACTPPDRAIAEEYCVEPRVEFAVIDTPVLVSWNAFTGGSPSPWSPTDSPKQIIGLRWRFPWTANMSAYKVDLTVDDVMLFGPELGSCVGSPGGAGGMGGLGGSAGHSPTGGAGAAGGRAGGFGGGAGGSSAGGGAGGGEQAGAGNEGGVAGQAGEPGGG